MSDLKVTDEQLGHAARFVREWPHWKYTGEFNEIFRSIVEEITGLRAIREDAHPNTGAGRDWSSDAERGACKAGEMAALDYSQSGGGPIGVFLFGLAAYREHLSGVEPAALAKGDPQ